MLVAHKAMSHSFKLLHRCSPHSDPQNFGSVHELYPKRSWLPDTIEVWNNTQVATM